MRLPDKDTRAEMLRNARVLCAVAAGVAIIYSIFGGTTQQNGHHNAPPAPTPPAPLDFSNLPQIYYLPASPKPKDTPVQVLQLFENIWATHYGPGYERRPMSSGHIYQNDLHIVAANRNSAFKLGDVLRIRANGHVMSVIAADYSLAKGNSLDFPDNTMLRNLGIHDVIDENKPASGNLDRVEVIGHIDLSKLTPAEFAQIVSSNHNIVQYLVKQGFQINAGEYLELLGNDDSRNHANDNDLIRQLSATSERLQQMEMRAAKWSSQASNFRLSTNYRTLVSKSAGRPACQICSNR